MVLHLRAKIRHPALSMYWWTRCWKNLPDQTQLRSLLQSKATIMLSKATIDSEPSTPLPGPLVCKASICQIQSCSDPGRNLRMGRLPYIVRCGRQKTSLHAKESQTEGTGREGWSAMASVVGTVNARSITKQRHEPGNALRPVVRSPRGVIKLTDVFNCQAGFRSAARRLAGQRNRRPECRRRLVLRPQISKRSGVSALCVLNETLQLRILF